MLLKGIITFIDCWAVRRLLGQLIVIIVNNNISHNIVIIGYIICFTKLVNK